MCMHVCSRYGEGEWLHYNYVTIFSSNDIITRVAMAIAKQTWNISYVSFANIKEVHGYFVHVICNVC